MQFQYAAPSTPTERPRCWGKAFDEVTRECRGCGYQTTCKEEIVRMNIQRPIVQPYFQPSTPYATPQPIPNHVQPLVPSQPYHGFRGSQMSQVPVPQPMQVRPVQLPQQPYGYGWAHDPLYYAIASSPPPVRPQFDGETFFDRVVKNTGLAMLESFFGQCMLAIRQMVLNPSRPVEESSQQVPPQIR